MKISIDEIGCEVISDLEIVSTKKEILTDVFYVRLGGQDGILSGLSYYKG